MAEQAYRRSDALKRSGRPMDAWSAYCGPKTSANIVQLRKQSFGLFKGQQRYSNWYSEYGVRRKSASNPTWNTVEGGHDPLPTVRFERETRRPMNFRVFLLFI